MRVGFVSYVFIMRFHVLLTYTSCGALPVVLQTILENDMYEKLKNVSFSKNGRNENMLFEFFGEEPVIKEILNSRGITHSNKTPSFGAPIRDPRMV